MAVHVVVMPTGPLATPAAIAAWKTAGQRVANERNTEIDLRSRDAAGLVISYLVAAPDFRHRLAARLGR